LLDPGREQVYDLSDTRRTNLWAPGRGIDPAQVGLTGERRQRVEERPGGWLACSAAAMSSARSPRYGPSGASSTITSSPTATPASRIHIGVTVNVHPLPPVAFVPRTSLPPIVPPTRCPALAPHL
jgi:hypothetical protein